MITISGPADACAAKIGPQTVIARMHRTAPAQETTSPGKPSPALPGPGPIPQGVPTVDPLRVNGFHISSSVQKYLTMASSTRSARPRP